MVWLDDLECYIYHTERTGSDDFTVYQCGREKCTPLCNFGPAARGYFLIHFIESGSGVFMTNKQVYYPIAGDIFVIYPNEPAYYESNSDDTWTYSWVAFAGANVAEHMERIWLNSGGFLRSSYNCKPHMENILSAARDDNYIRLLGHVYLLIAELISGSTNVSDEKQLSSTRLFKSALQYIHRNYARKITVASLARHLYIDRSYLFRIFYSKLGTSPNQYLMKLRIRRACELLRQTSMFIYEISGAVGFKEHSHFSVTFHKYLKMTPLAFRKLPNRQADVIIEEMLRHGVNAELDVSV